MNKEEYWEKYDSISLLEQFSDDIDIWWDKDRFDWSNNIYVLCVYLSDKFDIWWDSKKFDWEYGSILCKLLPYKFDTWWDKDKFYQKNDISYLHKYLLNKIVNWYTLEKIDNDRCIRCDQDILDSIESIVDNLEWNYD